MKGLKWFHQNKSRRINIYVAGPEIAYLYPDLRTGLVGEYADGELVCGRPAQLTGISMRDNILIPHFTLTSNR
jgi:hypothetical protein